MQWRHPRSALFLAGALLALSGPFGGPAVAVPAAGAPSTAASQASDGPDPIDFAVVVDQSASLADKDLVRETEAAALLGQGEISDRSRATVIGFGSSEKAGQSPVREVCPLITVDEAGRRKLSDCVQGLSRRDSALMGPGTDFPAAIRQAVSRLTEAAGSGTAGKTTPKVVFLLTDGKLDVGDSPEYGTDPASRQANGAKRLDEELARARAAGVQIWPLGFGSGIDKAALTAMAEGGYRGACSDVPGATPRMRVAATSAEIDKALQEAFAGARCARVSHGTVGKPPADLYVTIPPIATDGSLTVSKHDPKVRVTYYDPNGRKVPTHGTFEDSAFEVSGEDGPVEALRVKNPLPGRWRIRVEAPEGHDGQEVAVRAIWQGRLRSVLTLDPAAPRAGQQAVVEVRMQTRRGVVITDPGQLEGIGVTVELSGDGFSPVSARLADDGRAPDRRAGDVRFTGTLTVPAGAAGKLRLIARMSAPGVTSDERPLYTTTTVGTPEITAGLSVDRVTVHPGGTVHGTLSVTNNGTAPRTLRLSLTDGTGSDGSGAGTAGSDASATTGDGAGSTPGAAQLGISPATVVAPPGKQTSLAFTVTVGEGTPLGELGGQVAVVDTADPDRPLDTAFLDVSVAPWPTWWETYWSYVAGGAAVLALLGAFAAVRLAARRRRRALAGTRLELRRDGRTLDTLTIRAGQSVGGEFHFTVDEVRGAAPTLRRARGGGAHRLRRNGAGELLLRLNRGREEPVRAGEAFAVDDCELVVQGARPPDRTARTARTPRTARTRIPGFPGARSGTRTGTRTRAGGGSGTGAGDGGAGGDDTTWQPGPALDTDGTGTRGTWNGDF
ncbi:VWA domain-containing protein [Streptomyces sp. NPDC051079]|uniref:VWA domain-containing protein n=1 Tax=unclassified Streptomyces TaxID=2593676 RepID=UPI00344D9EC1